MYISRVESAAPVKSVHYHWTLSDGSPRVVVRTLKYMHMWRVASCRACCPCFRLDSMPKRRSNRAEHVAVIHAARCARAPCPRVDRKIPFLAAEWALLTHLERHAGKV